MMVSQQPVPRRPFDAASIDKKNLIASIESRSDYLLTPEAQTQLPEPVKTRGDVGGLVDVLQQLQVFAKRQLPRIAVKAKGKIFFVDIADIVAVHADGNYASIKCGSTPYFVRESLCSIAAKLSPYGFIQIRRSVLVNISLVAEIQPLGTREYRLRLGGGTEYVVTRKYKENLRHVAHLWLGSEPVFSSAPVEC